MTSLLQLFAKWPLSYKKVGPYMQKSGYSGYSNIFQAWFVRNHFHKKSGYTTGYSGYKVVTKWLQKLASKN